MANVLQKWGPQTYEIAGQQVALPTSYAYNPPATVQVTNPTGVMGPPSLPPSLAGPATATATGISPGTAAANSGSLTTSASPVWPAVFGLLGGLLLLWWIFWSEGKRD